MKRGSLLLLILVFIVLSLQGGLSQGEPLTIVPIGEEYEYYINMERIIVKIFENGSALVTMDLFPTFITGQTGPLNISLPYIIDQLKIIRVSCIPIQHFMNFRTFPSINDTKVEVYLLHPQAYIELVYLLDDVLDLGEGVVEFRFSETVHIKELHLRMELPERYGVNYPSARISPPSSLQTYQLPVLALSGQSNLVVEMSNIKAVTISIRFKVKRIDIRKDLLTLLESLLLSVGIPSLIFLVPRIYGERLNIFTLALKNNLRRREKFYINLFGVSTTISLISSILVQSRVIRSIIQSMGEGPIPSVGPYMYLLIGITLLIGGFLVFETNLSSVLARKVELAILKAIGFDTMGITKMVLVEGIFLGLVSGIVGSLTGALFAIFPYVKLTNYYRAPPISKLQEQVGGVFLLLAPAISLVLGKIYLKRWRSTVKMAFIALLLNIIQFYFRYVLRPFVDIPLLSTVPLMMTYCTISVIIALAFITIAVLYPSIKAGITKPMEMMRSV